MFHEASFLPLRLRVRLPFLVFILVYALWALVTFRDYGVTFDEYAVYWAGKYLLENMLHGQWNDLLLLGSGWQADVRHYHHAYPALLFALTGKLSIPLFHFWNMVAVGFVFWLSYELLLHATQKSWASLLGPIVLACMPRFVGDIPNNPKDIPFALFHFAFLTGLYLWKDRLSLPRCLVLGSILGMAVGARTVGLTLLPLWLAWVVIDGWFQRHNGRVPLSEKNQFLTGITSVAIILITATLCLLSTWPWLRAAPFSHALYLLHISHQFPWNGLVFFNGVQTPAAQLPLSYLPTWLIATVPLLWLCLPILLPLILLKGKNPLLSFLSLILIFHAVLYLTLHPVLYDGMRHYLFILPVWATADALIIIRFWDQSSSRIQKTVLTVLVCLQVVATGRSMVLLHPYEYIYFNEGVGGLKCASKYFEVEYMGSSYKEAVEWLNEHLPPGAEKVRVNTEGHAFQSGYYFGPRLVWTNLSDADYYITTTRGGKHLTVPTEQIVHLVVRDGIPICYVFRLKKAAL